MGDATDREMQRRKAVSKRLTEIGIKRGVLQTMAKNGQLIKIQCETPKCYRETGRGFPTGQTPNSSWSPTVDHYPTLKSNCGHKDPWNVRLAHKKCNGEDYAWRKRIDEMIKAGKSLEQMAEQLNSKSVDKPKGAGPWTAASVRWAFVSS
jgi:hypothetical protein